MNRVKKQIRRDRIARAIVVGFVRTKRWERRRDLAETPHSSGHREAAARKRQCRRLRNLETVAVRLDHRSSGGYSGLPLGYPYRYVARPSPWKRAR